MKVADLKNGPAYLVAFRKMASTKFMSDVDPCQSVSPAWKKKLKRHNGGKIEYLCKD